MKVLFLTNIPAPYRVDFFSELGKKVDLTVIYERESALSRDDKWKSSAPKTFHEIFLKGKKIGDDNSFSLQILKYIKLYRYDTIIIGQYSTFTAMLAIAYMKFKKISFILNSDGGFIKNDNFFKYKFKKFFISGASYWLSTGKMTNKYLSYYGADLKKCFIYPFTSLTQKDILENQKFINEKQKFKNLLKVKKKYMVLTVGRFLEIKGIDLLVRAASQVNDDIEIYIVGGEPTEEFLNIIQQYNIHNIVFVDFMEKEKLANYYRAADLFVMPTRGDVWGLVINEALSFGLPIISSKKCIAGLELINSDNGIIIEENEDYRFYSTAINNFFDLNKFDSKNCCESIKDYTIENMANETYKILEEINEKRDDVNEK